MTLSFQSFSSSPKTPALQCADTHPKFEGTGKDGKPRVAIGKADYTLWQLQSLIDSPDVEIVGVNTDGDSFARTIEKEKPDVVVIGSQFADDPYPSPPNVVIKYQESHPTQPLGIVYHSSFTSDDLLRSAPNFVHVKGGVDVGDRGDVMINAVKQVDPYPINS